MSDLFIADVYADKYKLDSHRIYEKMVGEELGYPMRTKWDPRKEAIAKLIVDARITSASARRERILSGQQDTEGPMDGLAWLYLVISENDLDTDHHKNVS
jgi:hypothetical protein